jgi:hypothetical protein
VFTLYYALTDNTQIDAHLCFWEISPAVFAFNMTLGLMFAIGFDRLCSVAFPIWYSICILNTKEKSEITLTRHMHVNSLGNSRTKQFYLAGILIAATGVAFWLVYQDFTHMNSSLSVDLIEK